jgi:hypothetical protein
MSHTLAYNGTQTTMVASVYRASHGNGWNFHSNLHGLIRDVNVDSEQQAPQAPPSRRQALRDDALEHSLQLIAG